MRLPLARLPAWLLSLWLLCGAGFAAADEPQAVARLVARVNDSTATLTAQQRGLLEAKLTAFEGEKGAQIAVLIVPTVKPETVEQYALRVVEATKLGRRGTDDGALLLVAKDDRKLRIEVGYGLEGALNDATAKRIISETIGPRFKQGDYYGGIDAGITQLIGLVDGEPLPEPDQAWSPCVRGRLSTITSRHCCSSVSSWCSSSVGCCEPFLGASWQPAWWVPPPASSLRY